MTDAILLIDGEHEMTLASFLAYQDHMQSGTARAVGSLDVGDWVRIDRDRGAPLHVERVA